MLDADGSPLNVNKFPSQYTIDTTDLLLFNYPLRNEPNFLLNLAPLPAGVTKVSGGIGPDPSGPYTIVAFSAICQHLGCPAPAISYYPPGTCGKKFGNLSFYIHCSCHGSTYDVTDGASNLTGPAILPLPQVVLEKDTSGNIFATGMTPNSPTVNGHLNTLQGDYGVGDTSQLASEAPVILCSNFPSVVEVHG